MKYFVPEKDVIGKKDDGRAFIVAHGGVPIPYVQAERLGIIPEKVEEGQVKEIEASGEAEGPGIRAARPPRAKRVPQQ